MRYLLLLVIVPATLWSKGQTNFNHALNEDHKAEIKHDDLKYRKKNFRGPASVGSELHAPVIRVPDKIDKNVRQIGPNKW